jgi:hypothetical protein
VKKSKEFDFHVKYRIDTDQNKITHNNEFHRNPFSSLEDETCGWKGKTSYHTFTLFASHKKCTQSHSTVWYSNHISLDHWFPHISSASYPPPPSLNTMNLNFRVLKRSTNLSHSTPEKKVTVVHRKEFLKVRLTSHSLRLEPFLCITPSDVRWCEHPGRDLD